MIVPRTRGAGSGNRGGGSGGAGGAGGPGGPPGWVPYGQPRRERVWPRLLLVTGVIAVLIAGSVLIARGLAGMNGDDDDGTLAGNGTPAATAPSSANGTPGADTGSAEGDGTAEPGADGSPGTGGIPTGTITAQPTPTAIDLGSSSTPKHTAENWAEVWSNGNYDQLYDLLTTEARGRISREDFVARYEAIAVEAGIVTVEARVDGGNDDDELFPLKVKIESSRVGDITDEHLLALVPEGDGWGVDWSPSLIFSQLGDGYVQWTSDVPARGRVLDRKGRPLAMTGQLTSIGVITGQIENEAELLSKLSQLLNMPSEQVQARYSGGQPDWFMPVKDLPESTDQALIDQLKAIPGVAVQKTPARVYPQGELTAHIVGYMSEVTAEELPELAKLGYESGDLVGRAGIEASMERTLAGKRGGVLALIGADGSIIRVLGQVAKEPAKDIVLTLDIDLQRGTWDAMGDIVGSSVVLDPNNGEVLAMVSKPSFDPNWFTLGITDEQWAILNDATKQPLLNRAVAVGYPSGSVFKVVTAAAGMAHLGMTDGTPVSCPGTFTLGGITWADWVPGGQGDMDLHTAIVRSCNTVFYSIGSQLDEQNEMWLPDMARAFGFGLPTGLPELYEVPGIVPDPDWKMANVDDFWARGDAVNLAIGQGYYLSTPLQMANAYAAIANGGVLYQPHLTLDIVNVDGSVASKGEVKEIGRLPLSGDQIAWLQSALYDVINASNGTAIDAFEGINYQVSGKTGSAETVPNEQQPHAWFAAYTPSDAPKIAVVSMVEFGVAGSRAAAPVSRRIIDAWYALGGQ